MFILDSPIRKYVASLATLLLPLCGNCLAEATKPSDTDKSESIEIRFAGGNKARGTKLTLVERSVIRLQSSHLNKPAEFKVNQILSVDFPRKEHSPTKARKTLIYLHARFREAQGDILAGTLKEITKDFVILETPYAQTLTIGRNYIQNIKQIQTGKGYYHGTNTLTEWTVIPKSSWRYNKGIMEATGAGQIGIDVNLQPLSHISFDASWKNSLRFKSRFFTNQNDTKNLDAYYEVSINRSYAYMSTRGKHGKNLAPLGGGRWQQITVRPETNQAHFDFFMNRKTGIVKIYIDGKESCQLESATPNPKNLGTGLSFIAEERYPIKISNISVAPWDGKTLPRQEEQANKPRGKAHPIPPLQVCTQDGRSFTLSTAKVEKNQLHLKQEEADPVSIPLNELSLITFHEDGQQPKKLRHDVRAWFQHGGKITLNLKSLSDGKITGFNQALGEVSLDLAAIAHIEFNIYDHRLNTERSGR